AIVTIGWHSSRLDRKPQMHPDEFRLMCHCVITCRTLEQVIERQAAFFRTRLEKISTIGLERGEGTAHILVDTLRRRT
ncbi:AraC family transcriptional regulator, partial [Escherichia coli]|nr:AraC family transcriptional regulator [Escherichia coli]